MEDSVNLVDDFYYKEEVYDIIKCAFTVYNTLGFGFLEAVYQEALEIEFRKNGIEYVSQKPLTIYYQGEELSKKYFADIVVDDKIIIELKAISSLTQADSSQLINYLKATGIKLGLLINFGNRRKLEWERRVFTDSRYQKKENIPE